MSRLPTAYFEQCYDREPDPWGLADRWYERRKRALVAAALPEPRYASGFEPGCAGGFLSELLAPRCDRLLCWDAVDVAAERAARRLAGFGQVRVERAAVPDRWPAPPGGEPFDLVVLCELGYYLDVAGLGQLADRVAGSLRPLGTLVAAHWRHPAADHLLSGDAVHEQLRADPRLARVSSVCEADFLLDVFLAAPAGTAGLSVAQRAGIVEARA